MADSDEEMITSAAADSDDSESPKKHKSKKKHKKKHKKHKKHKKRSRDVSDEDSDDDVGSSSGEEVEDTARSAAVGAAEEEGIARPSKRQKHKHGGKEEEEGDADGAASPSQINLGGASTPTSSTTRGAKKKKGVSPKQSPTAPTRLKQALFGEGFEAFNLLADPRFNRDEVVTSLLVPILDFSRVLKTLGAGMKLEKANCWIVKDHVPACDHHVHEATDTKREEHCGAPSTWVLKTDGHFVCDKHKPTDGGAHPVTAANRFTGLVVIGTNDINMAVRAHIPGHIDKKLGDINSFEVYIKTAEPMIKRAMQYATDRCKNIRILITRDASGIAKLSFTPEHRRVGSTKVSGLMVDIEEMRHFDASLEDMPLQMNVNSEVTLMLSLPLLSEFKSFFGAHAGAQLEFAIDQMVPARKGALAADTELLSLTIKAGLDASTSIVLPKRTMFSCSRVIKTTAGKNTSAAGASVQFAVTRVERVDMDRNKIGRLLRQNGGKDFTGRHLVKTRYARDQVVNTMNIMVQEFNVASVVMFTGTEPSPLTISHMLPNGGILNISVGVAFEEEEE